MIENNLVVSASKFVIDFLERNLPDWAKYHNIDHTYETVEAIKEICIHYDLPSIDIKALIIAGWFHDIGYVFGQENHEEKSVEIATDYLNSKNCSFDLIQKIMKCILATNITSEAHHLMECIIKDADLISLAKPDYFIKNELLKEEFELKGQQIISEANWLLRSEKFLSNHRYLTSYVKNNYNKQLEQNLFELRRKIHNQL